MSLRLSWTPINAAKREAGCASAIRRLQQTVRCGSVGRDQKIDTIDVPFYLPARGPIQEKAGGLFVSRVGTRRGGRSYGRYGESSIRLEMTGYGVYRRDARR